MKRFHELPLENRPRPPQLRPSHLFRSPNRVLVVLVVSHQKSLSFIGIASFVDEHPFLMAFHPCSKKTITHPKRRLSRACGYCCGTRAVMVWVCRLWLIRKRIASANVNNTYTGFLKNYFALARQVCVGFGACKQGFLRNQSLVFAKKWPPNIREDFTFLLSPENAE